MTIALQQTSPAPVSWGSTSWSRAPANAFKSAKGLFSEVIARYRLQACIASLSDHHLRDIALIRGDALKASGVLSTTTAAKHLRQIAHTRAGNW